MPQLTTTCALTHTHSTYPPSCTHTPTHTLTHPTHPHSHTHAPTLPRTKHTPSPHPRTKPPRHKASESPVGPPHQGVCWGPQAPAPYSQAAHDTHLGTYPIKNEFNKGPCEPYHTRNGARGAPNLTYVHHEPSGFRLYQSGAAALIDPWRRAGKPFDP